MTNVITNYLKYAHLQIAAEAFYNLKGKTKERYSGPAYEPVLLRGNDRSSKFTTTDAQWFATDWEVVEHISNTTTGIFGTLFKAKPNDEARGITAGELVLSFRSTEFIDDAAPNVSAALYLHRAGATPGAGMWVH
jgi:hypothetical protein